LKNSKKIELMK